MLSESNGHVTDDVTRRYDVSGDKTQPAARIPVLCCLPACNLTGVWHEIATEGHSRSSILQSGTSRQGIAYRHNTSGLRPMSKSPKIAVVDNPTVIFDTPPRGTPRISAYTLYIQKLESLAYILPLVVLLYLHSNFCSGLQNKSFVR